MSGAIVDVFGDAQTTITSLAAGIGGVASSALGDFIVSRLGNDLRSNGGIGAIGLEFAGRAVISSAVFAGLHWMMPRTSENVFFSILFFAANRGLMGTALTLSGATIGAFQRLNLKPPQASPPPVSNAMPSPAKSGGCSTCY